MTYADQADECVLAFSFLETELAYEERVRTSSASGFDVRFAGPSVGVIITFHIRDPVEVTVCLLEEDGEFPYQPRNLSADTVIRKFPLADLEAAAGIEVTDPQPNWGIVYPELLDELAARLRAAGGGLLAGDLGTVPALRERIRARTRERALREWGPEAAAHGWYPQ